MCPSVIIHDWNLMTTPIVHHHVNHYNDVLGSPIEYDLEKISDFYYTKLGSNFKKILELTKDKLTKNANSTIFNKHTYR